MSRVKAGSPPGERRANMDWPDPRTQDKNHRNTKNHLKSSKYTKRTQKIKKIEHNVCWCR
eukprot:9466585-Karenia_brevis.AAC.1